MGHDAKNVLDVATFGLYRPLSDSLTPENHAIEDPPDPEEERAKAEEAATKKIEERRRKILSGGRQSTIHALGTPAGALSETLGA